MIYNVEKRDMVAGEKTETISLLVSSLVILILRWLYKGNCCLRGYKSRWKNKLEKLKKGVDNSIR